MPSTELLHNISDHGSKEPVIIIAHGAFHQASHYDSFALTLNQKGYAKVRTPQLPSSGRNPPAGAFEKDVALLRQTIIKDLTNGETVLLVGHSYGSIPLTEALNDIENEVGETSRKIMGIIFIAAMIPDDGENLATAMKTGVAPWVKIEGDMCRADNPAYTFYNVLSDLKGQAAVDAAISHVTPQATAAFITPICRATWANYPCTYVKCMKDNSTSLEDQDYMIEKIKLKCGISHVVELESDHCPMICMPDEVAEVVLQRSGLRAVS